MLLDNPPALANVGGGHNHKIDGDCIWSECPIIPTTDPRYRNPHITESLAKLEALGDVEHVVMFFAEQGISGWTTSPTLCPISNYLSSEVPSLDANSQIGVGTEAAHVWRHDDGVTTDVVYPLGPVASEFVVRFDEHEFPALERPECEHPNRRWAALS